MKQTIILLLAILLAGSALGQSRTIKTGTAARPSPQLITATAFALDSVPTADCTHLVVWNDTTAGTDTLWVAANNDTTAANLLPVYQGQSVRLDGLQARWIRRKTSGHTVHSRALAY